MWETKVGVSFGDESHEFNFSMFSRKLHEKELPSKDEIIGPASIVVPPTDPLEQYFLAIKMIYICMKEMK